MNFYDNYITKALPDVGNGSDLQDSLELQIIEDPVKEAFIISGLSDEEERRKQIDAFTSMMRENVTKNSTLDKETSLKDVQSTSRFKHTDKITSTKNQGVKKGGCSGRYAKPVSTPTVDAGNWEKKFALEENRYLSVSKFRGDFKIHIRDWFQDTSGTLRPTKSGVVMSTKQWRKMKLLMKSVDEALHGEADM